MVPPDSVDSLAYARVLLELGLLPEARLRPMAQACQVNGLDLRDQLLRRGLIDAEGDARVRALIAERSAEHTRDAVPSPPPARRRVLPQRLPQPGDLFAGHLIDHEIARGGAGAVFVARAPDGQQVALKILLGDMRDEHRRQRFAREALVGQRLKHPGLVVVNDHGFQDELAWLSMQLLDGAQPLDDYVREAALPLAKRVELIVEVAMAVAAANAEGVIHRDLKPDNVLVTREGHVKVVDFGLARHVDEERITRSGVVMGTVHYMAPEQVYGRAAHADARTDVYALGVMLYHLVSGRLPFTGDSGLEIMAAITREPTPDLRAAGVDLEGLDRLADVAACAMSKEPGDRYATADALAHDLVAVLGGSDELAATGLNREAQARTRRGQHRRLLLGAGLLVLLAAAAGVAFRPRSGPDPQVVLEGVRAWQADASKLAAREGPGAAQTSAVAALRARLEALEAQTSAASATSGVLDGARARLQGLEGILALARGERPTPPAGDDPAVDAVRGGLLALDPAADAAKATRLLSRALERRVRWTELRGWRAVARVRAALATPRGLTRPAAHAVLADLDAAPGEGAPALRAWALIGLGRVSEARALFQATAPAPELAWALALARVAQEMRDDPTATLALLSELPPAHLPVLQRRRSELAKTARSMASSAQRASQGGPRAKGAAAPVVSLLGIAFALDPRAPLPPRLLDQLLEEVASAGRWNGALSQRLSTLLPHDAARQRRLALVLARLGGVDVRRRHLPVMRRALALAPETDLDLRVAFVRELARLARDCEFEPGGVNAAESRQILETSAWLLERLTTPKHRPERAEVLVARSLALLARGKLDEALLSVERGLALQRKHIYHYDHARVLEKLGREQAAWEAYGNFVETAGDSSGRLDHGMARHWDLFRAEPTRREARTRQVVSIFLRLRRGFAGWFVRGTWLALRRGDTALAQAYLARTLSDPRMIELSQIGKHEAAIRVLHTRVERGDVGPDAIAEARRLVRAIDAQRGDDRLP